MKHITKILSIASAAVLAGAAASCDHISQDDRFIVLPAVEGERVILLEEFTGQLCVNCPEAHELIAKLVQQHPNNFIAVGIHGGGDAWSYDAEKVPYGLRVPEGQAYSDANGIYSFPSGIIDRKSGVMSRDEWADFILKEIERPTQLELTAEAVASTDGSEITIAVEITPFQNFSANLQLWVVESGIVAPQRTSSGWNAKYVHDHVFRGCVNGQNGDAMDFVLSEPKNVEYKVAVSEKWNLGNLEIVAFVYNAAEGVMQATKCEIERTE